MPYSRRVTIATIISVLLHGALFWLGLRAAEAVPKPMYEEAKAPVVFHLEPKPEQQQVKRLISTPNPTTEEVEDTDLISDNDSKAQDQSDVEGERPAPHIDEPDDFDRVEQSRSEPQPPVIEQPEIVETIAEPEPIIEDEVPVEKPEPIPEELPEPVKVTVDQPELLESDSVDETLIENEPVEEPEKITEKPTEETPEESKLPERFEVARADPQPSLPTQQPLPKKLTQDLSTSRGRAGGGTAQSGVMNFEAKSHEMGEYMLEVRRRVERQWHTAIQLRYLGTRRASATIECVIRPSGIIEELRIIDSGTSMPFAILCRDAIQNAGPFPKLSFEVPEIYRSQNIEIRWKFSYL